MVVRSARGHSSVTSLGDTSHNELGWLLLFTQLQLTLDTRLWTHIYVRTHINTQTRPHALLRLRDHDLTMWEIPHFPAWGGHLFPELFKGLLYRESWYWWMMPPCNYVSFNNRWVGQWGVRGWGGWCPLTSLARTAGMVIWSDWC